MSAGPESCPALVLNADFRPLNYFPLSLWSWQEAVKAVFLDRVNVVSEYDTEIHSPSWKMKLPSVISLKEYVHLSRRPAFTRFNVFLRDQFACQYCGQAFPTHELTFDHVIPRSRGGRTEWTNVVTACGYCNLTKADKLIHEVGMHIRRPAAQPTNYQLHEAGRRFPPNYLHESWRDFLYWDSELEPF
jgi:5-methylcytosine-specific restriction endonuclease McrA